MIKSMLMVAVAVIMLAQSFPVLAASFNCSNASTKVEKMICADNGLSDLDDQLAVAYKGSLEAANDKNALKQDQRDWIKKRNELTNVNELTGFYQTRIEALHEMIESGGSGQQAQQPAAATDKSSQEATQGAGAPIPVNTSAENVTNAPNTQPKVQPEGNNASNQANNTSSGSLIMGFGIIAVVVLIIIIFIIYVIRNPDFRNNILRKIWDSVIHGR